MYVVDWGDSNPNSFRRLIDDDVDVDVRTIFVAVPIESKKTDDRIHSLIVCLLGGDDDDDDLGDIGDFIGEAE